jgi:hypothetical protein
MPTSPRLEPVTQEHGPEDFYKRLGFRPTGEYNEGETMAERILSASGDDQSRTR